MDEPINPIEEIISKEEEAIILREMGKIEGVQEYFRALMARDMRLHFTCPKDQQDLTRGAYFRTEWLGKQIAKYSLDSKQ